MIAIIGGGPAGIALGAALDSRSAAYDMFEARSLAATWRDAPANLHVLSPWWTNVLRPSDAFRGNPFRKPLASEYLRHLLNLAGQLRGTIRAECPVSALERTEDGLWRLRTPEGVHGPYRAVVLATGYFFFPREAEPPIASDGSIPALHASRIRNYDELEALRNGSAPVVIVGSRVTAGQLLLELSARRIPCAVSVRSQIRFRQHGLLGGVREAAYYFWEALEASLRPGLKRASFPAMEGGETRRLLDSGAVAVLPLVDRIEDGDLVLASGSRMRAAAVISATGYRPGIDLLPSGLEMNAYGVPLQRNFEVNGADGLHLLGFDNLYDHRSRYLRGIRSDAIRLADKLATSPTTH